LTLRRARLAQAIALLAVCGVLAGSAALIIPMHASLSAPLDPNIPNEQILIDQGLSGTPDPRQPSSPVAVDRVLVDGAVTYVQYHLNGSLRGRGGFAPQLALTVELYDDHGVLEDHGVRWGESPSDPTPPLPAWFPWHPPVVQRGYAILGPLPATARAAVLRFMSGQSVRVPLHLQTLLRQPARQSNALIQQRGIPFQLTEVTEEHIILGYGSSSYPTGVTLMSHGGHPIGITNVDDECGPNVTTPSGLIFCRVAWVYPPQSRGTRLTLTIASFSGASVLSGYSGLPVGPGPWRFSFVVP